MFQDGRSRRVVFLAHCLLNQNAISDGTAVYPAAFRQIVRFFLKREIGIVQMPCPELSCLGLDRGDPAGATRPVVVENTRIRAAMRQADDRLNALVDHVMQQILAYHRYGFEIVGILGVNRSPCCGVETTSDHNQELAGAGLFLETLSNRLAEAAISVPMLGVKATDPLETRLLRLLEQSASPTPTNQKQE